MKVNINVANVNKYNFVSRSNENVRIEEFMLKYLKEKRVVGIRSG